MFFPLSIDENKAVFLDVPVYLRHLFVIDKIADFFNLCTSHLLNTLFHDVNPF